MSDGDREGGGERQTERERKRERGRERERERQTERERDGVAEYMACKMVPCMDGRRVPHRISGCCCRPERAVALPRGLAPQCGRRGTGDGGVGKRWGTGGQGRRSRRAHHEALAVPDLGDDLGGELGRDAVLALHVPVLFIEALPVLAGPQEVLVLDVHEVLRPPDLPEVRLVDAALNPVLPQPRAVAVDGPEHLAAPRARLREGLLGEAQERQPLQVHEVPHKLRRLLPPALLEVGHQVPRDGPLNHRVHVVPRLPGPVFG